MPLSGNDRMHMTDRPSHAPETSLPAPLPPGFWRLHQTAILLGALAVLTSWAIGYYAYVKSRETILRHVYETNLTLARTIATHAIVSGNGEREVLRELERRWAETKS